MYSMNSNHFTIDAINGSIYTKVALDREQQQRYELSVVAIDSAAAARSSRLIVTVIVQDVNDNGPVFEKVEYSVEIKEEHIAQDFLTLQVSVLTVCVICLSDLGSQTCYIHESQN